MWRDKGKVKPHIVVTKFVPFSEPNFLSRSSTSPIAYAEVRALKPATGPSHRLSDLVERHVQDPRSPLQ
jgi:hypothetical protein